MFSARRRKCGRYFAGKYGARESDDCIWRRFRGAKRIVDRVKQSLREAGIQYCEMGGVQPNPVDTKVYEGIELCRREQADLLLPVGGGSVIDTAKAIAAGVPYEGDFWDFFIGKAKVVKALKVAVVLTIPARVARVGQLGYHKSGYLAKTELACAGTVAPGFFHYESRIDLYIAAFSNGLRYRRYDGAYHGALFH